MKKLTLIALMLGVILMTGCEGDDPVGPGGNLADVTGFAIDGTSAGRTVVLTWNAVTDGAAEIDGYKIWFKENNSGTYVEIADIAVGTTTYSHTASAAGGYAIEAYKGDDTSSNLVTVNTMPNYVTTSYTVWDNHAPADEHSGFRFGATAGETGLAGSGSFATEKDLYCWDGDWTQSPVGFYSGAYGTFGNGHPTDMVEVQGGNYGYPSASVGDWWEHGFIVQNDVIFAELHDGYYVKIYVEAIPQHSTQPLSHGITFNYDFQPIQGLYLFTTDTQ